MQQLILVRGIPGAGKSTLGRIMKQHGYRHFEADQYRDKLNMRIYNKERNILAAAWCLGMTAEAMSSGADVIVTNTFCRVDQMQPYWLLVQDLRERGMKINLTVTTVEGSHGSVHENVNYDKYREEWEPYQGEFNDPA